MIFLIGAPSQALGEIFTYKGKSQEEKFTLIGDDLPNKCSISSSTWNYYILSAPSQLPGEILTYNEKFQGNLITLIGDVLPNRCSILSPTWKFHLLGKIFKKSSP